METTIKTYSGKLIDYANVNHDEICITDIAHHLSREMRFLGRTDEPYSVAQHSLLCAEIAKIKGLSPYMQLRVLMHDFHEAYLKDIPTPLKQMLGNIYKKLEDEFDTAIEKRYCLNPLSQIEKQVIKEIDLIALATEKHFLLDDEDEWQQLANVEHIEEIDKRLLHLSYTTAEAFLLKKFNELWDNAFYYQPHSPYIIKE